MLLVLSLVQEKCIFTDQSFVLDPADLLQYHALQYCSSAAHNEDEVSADHIPCSPTCHHLCLTFIPQQTNHRKLKYLQSMSIF